MTSHFIILAQKYSDKLQKDSRRIAKVLTCDLRFFCTASVILPDFVYALSTIVDFGINTIVPYECVTVGFSSDGFIVVEHPHVKLSHSISLSAVVLPKFLRVLLDR